MQGNKRRFRDVAYRPDKMPYRVAIRRINHVLAFTYGVGPGIFLFKHLLGPNTARCFATYDYFLKKPGRRTGLSYQVVDGVLKRNAILKVTFLGVLPDWPDRFGVQPEVLILPGSQRLLIETGQFRSSHIRCRERGFSLH